MDVLQNIQLLLIQAVCECSGWMLRYVGKADRKVLMAFCDEHLRHFTPEGLRYALEKQPAEVRKRYAARLKQLNASPEPLKKAQVKVTVKKSPAKPPQASKRGATKRQRAQ